jgi:predicted Zn-dependent peptidase
MINERNLRRTILPNGLIVLTERMDHLRSVAMGVWIKSGSRGEAAETNGISHFVEHMVFKGTRNRSAQLIAREMDSIGGNLDAFTGKETICFNVKSLADHVPIALDVLADLVLNPVFASNDIERERGVILEEIKIDEDNPDVLVHELFTPEFLERPSPRQANPGHHGDGGQARSTQAAGLPRGPFPRRQHGVLRRRQSRP